VRVEFKSKAVVHFDQQKAALASASFLNNCSVYTVAANALAVCELVYTHLFLGSTYKRNWIGCAFKSSATIAQLPPLFLFIRRGSPGKRRIVDLLWANIPTFEGLEHSPL
jgi:hypothetical protein